MFRLQEIILPRRPSYGILPVGFGRHGCKYLIHPSGIVAGLPGGPIAVAVIADFAGLEPGKCTLTLSASDGFTGDINQGTTFAYAPSGINSSAPKVED